jgi:hypothetical protein
MQFITIIEELSRDFINAFNNRDFTKLESHLSIHFFIVSDNIQRINPAYPDNRISGASEVIQYWRQLVTLFPEFKFDPSEHEIENQGKNILYSGHLVNGKPYSARFTINEYAKFDCLIMSYPESI